MTVKKKTNSINSSIPVTKIAFLRENSQSRWFRAINIYIESCLNYIEYKTFLASTKIRYNNISSQWTVISLEVCLKPFENCNLLHRRLF